MKAARAFGVIAVEFLGLPSAYLPFDLSEKDNLLGEWLLHDVLESGIRLIGHSVVVVNWEE